MWNNFSAITSPASLSRANDGSPRISRAFVIARSDSDEAIQYDLAARASRPGLLRFARNDEQSRSRGAFLRPSHVARHEKEPPNK
jgi:hypothetical protein